MIAYPVGLGFILILPLLLVPGVPKFDSAPVIVGITILGAIILVLTGIWTIRRVQDFNGPWWVSAIFVLTMIFLPIVNFLLWVIPGTKGENRYGPPPPPNGAGVVILAFLLLGLPVIGIVAAIVIPAYFDYSVMAKVQEGVTLSNPHRSALANACREGKLGQELYYSTFGISEPSSHTGKYVKSVAIADVSSQVAEVTVTYRAIGNAITDGQTVDYIGTCRGAEVYWEVAGTIPEKFRPEI